MKYTAIVLVLLLCFLMLCACGKQTDTTEPTTIPTTTGSTPTAPTLPTELPTENGDPELPPKEPTTSKTEDPTENTEDKTFPIPIPSQPDVPENGTLPPPIEDDGNWGPLF